MKSILVICEGNICRSPMAEALLGSVFPKMRVRSAGLAALIGGAADETAVRLMLEIGIDISAHRGTQVTRQMCTEADLILAMDTNQKRELQDIYPFVRGRVFRLGEYSRTDIPDPYRHPEVVFRSSLALIQQGIAEWTNRIQRIQGAL